MKYKFLKEALDLIEEYENEGLHLSNEKLSIEGFKKWISLNYQLKYEAHEPDWEGKEKGRSPESVINTLIVHMNRYARLYSKSAIHGSEFSTQEDFIYLINLKASGEMTKMELIKKNVHEKSAGMQIIKRLIDNKWVSQRSSEVDKRSKLISITKKGVEVLEKQMDKIRQATTIVTGNLTEAEKLELIRLLNKLNEFHLPIYEKNIENEHLLSEVINQYIKTESNEKSN